MLTASEIAAAKRRTVYLNPDDVLHEHDDCIRIAHEWLCAQQVTQRRRYEFYGIAAFRSLIIRWGGSYVSKDDVMVALAMQDRVKADLHSSNLTKRLVLPSDRRLVGLDMAFRHPDQRERLRHDMHRYAYSE